MRYALSLGVLAVWVGLWVPVEAAWLDPVADPTIVVVSDSADARMDGYGDPWPPYGQGGQDEWLNQYGTYPTSRIKGFQECFAMKFNLAAHVGKTVSDAELHICRSNGQPIHALVAATINTDWTESTVSWRYRVGTTDWTYPRSDFTTACFGNHGSLVCYGYRSSSTYGTYVDSGARTWIRMKLDPYVAAALILDQYGLAATDPRGYLYGGYNPEVYTREMGTVYQPKVYIKFASSPDTTPANPVTGLTAAAGPENGQIVLTFVAPTDPVEPKAFGYNVRYSTGTNFAIATKVDRWRIPRPAAPGTTQKVLIEGLTPGTTYNYFVQAYDPTGNVSTVQSVALAVPSAWTAPTLKNGLFTTPDPTGKTVRNVPGVLNYWVTTELSKVNPATGNRIEDGYTGSGADNYKKANAVWDANTNTVSLSAARNEVVGCQLVLERIVANLTNVQVTVSSLTGSGGTLPVTPYVELFQLFYVSSGGWRYPDPAVQLAAPLATKFSIPDTNRNPGGVNQSVWIDIYVPKYTGLPSSPTTFYPGDYTGTINVAADQLGSPVTINLKLRVSQTTLPDTPTFIVDLNGYSQSGLNVWDFGTPFSNLQVCARYFQVTHKHRACVNTLPYGWNGSVLSDRQPSGWISFSSKYGPMFATSPSSSAFSRTNGTDPYYGPGENTPISHFYTGFNESWPASMVDPAGGFDPTPALPNCPGVGGAQWNTQLQSGLVDQRDDAFDRMPDVQIAWPAAYKTTVKNKVAEWFTNCNGRGYTKTNFQIYMNDKWSYSGTKALWTLEECECGDDFRALNFFHALYRAGETQSGVTNVKWHYRLDVSDRWGQNYGQLDNVLNQTTIGGGAGSWWWPNIKYRKYELLVPEEWWWYGGAPGIIENGIGHSKLFLQRWSQDFAGGVSYWDNFETSWTAAQDLSTVYKGSTLPGATNLYGGPIVANRIKMMRQAEQVIELLNLWAGASGMSFEKARESLKAKYGDVGTTDYGFSGLDENKLYRLKADLIAQVEASRYLLGDINGDGTVDAADTLRLASAFSAATGGPTYDSFCDLNADGKVDVSDLLKLAGNWGQTLPPP